MNDTNMQSELPAAESATTRLAVRWFVLLIASVIAIDAGPGTLPVVARAKGFVSAVLKRVGLWQGEWTLFAPNPAINNAWISAEVVDPNGELQTWNSTYWAGTSGWERFRGFRYINYSNRLPTQDQAVANDYADYLARQLISPTARPLVVALDATANAQLAPTTPPQGWKLSLFRSQLSLNLPEDGSLPPRDEVLWISTSTNLAIREYVP